VSFVTGSLLAQRDVAHSSDMQVIGLCGASISSPAYCIFIEPRGRVVYSSLADGIPIAHKHGPAPRSDYALRRENFRWRSSTPTRGGCVWRLAPAGYARLFLSREWHFAKHGARPLRHIARPRRNAVIQRHRISARCPWGSHPALIRQKVVLRNGSSRRVRAMTDVRGDAVPRNTNITSHC
jgi:hypothetical protein